MDTNKKQKFLNYYLPMFLILVVVFVFVFIAQTPKKTEASWYTVGGQGTWTYRKSITIDHTKVGVSTTTPLTDFPFLFSVTDTDLKSVSNGGKIASSTGGDLLFTASDGSTKLDHEIESYDPTTGTTIVWVRIPSVSPSVDTVIYVYFGNDNVQNNQNPTGVWDSNYKAVYHLKDGSTLSAKDSTINANDGTISTPTATTGKIDGAASFTTGDKITKTTNSSLSISGSFTLEAWVNQSNLTGYHDVITKTNSTSDGNYYLETNGSDIEIGFYNGSGFTGFNSSGSGTTMSTNNWYHIVAVYDNAGNALRGYINGTEVINQSAGGATPQTDANALSLGLGYVGENFLGTMDEARVYGGARSLDWIKTEYNNQSSPSTFFTYGSSESQSPGPRASTTPAVKLRGGGGGSNPSIKIRGGSSGGGGISTSSPTFVAKYETTWNDATLYTKNVMSSVPVNAGDLLVAVAASENNTNPLNITENGSSSWVAQYSDIGSAPVSVWTYQVTSNENLTVNFTTIGNGKFGGTVFRFSSNGGLGVKNSNNSTTGLPSLTLNGVYEKSTIIMIVSDWNAVVGTQTVDSSIGSFTAMTGYPGDGAVYGVFGGYYPDAGLTGNKTIGMTSPSGQNWTIAGIEVRGVASVGGGGSPGNVKFR